MTTITHGTPLNLELGGAFVDLGAEQRPGGHVIVLAVDDGEGYAHLDSARRTPSCWPTRSAAWPGSET